jgi:hypothetical protein
MHQPAAATAAAATAPLTLPQLAAAPAAPRGSPQGIMTARLLPAGLVLPDAHSLASIDQALAFFMHEGMRGLLPPEQYSNLMVRLRVAFGPYRQGGGSGAAAVSAGQLRQLRCMYMHVQAAVDGGLPGPVVAALEDLIGDVTASR